MAVLIIFAVIGVITTLIGLTFLAMTIGSSLAVEFRTFKFKVEKNSEVKKEAIEATAKFKAEQLAQIREKEQDLASLKTQKKLDELDKKILLEQKRQETSKEEPKEEPKEEQPIEEKKEEPKEEVKEPVEEQPTQPQETVVEEQVVEPIKVSE